MQSIWSVPQTQNKGRNQSTKLGFGNALKRMFVHNKKPQAQLHPFFAQQNNYYSNQQSPAHFKEHTINTHQQIFTQPVAAPLIQPSFHQGNNNQQQYLHTTNQHKGINIKNLTAIFHLLLPIALAVLGIPFYIMVILKLINFVH